MEREEQKIGFLRFAFSFTEKKKGVGTALPFFLISLSLLYNVQLLCLLSSPSQHLERLPDEQAPVKLHAGQSERPRRRAGPRVRSRRDDAETPPGARRGRAGHGPRAVAAGVVERRVVDVAAEHRPALLRLSRWSLLLVIIIFSVVFSSD